MRHLSAEKRSKNLIFYYAFIGLIVWGCATTKNDKQHVETLNVDNSTAQVQGNSAKNIANILPYGFDDHSYIGIHPDSITKEIIVTDLFKQEEINSEENGISKASYLKHISPVANKIVQNYLTSEVKEPGGHCLAVSKDRFVKAYKEVHGHLPYQDLPDSMATNIYTPKQVFNLLYVTASKPDKSWQSLPERYRGKGNAGAIVYAGMGTLVDATGIWSGQLKPGALMQVWRYKEDYIEVVKGANVKKLDPYGHSFIFISYVRDEKGKIKGLKIADQGFQSYRPLVPRDYDVWWAVNLSV
ncbi:hypothetical protein [Maribacter ulvicola]|uniref:Uncharacterized protein n=1 Tax=Maribacter ulvicola TaxID=228959 RepID=A0A1N6UDQ9_9FLAO|nr:hypothetical protein [Maribacter ulvicola]SIQ63724.1 hypothetical protein SAMN05421797_102305 [Maribacter ulvicola]